MPAQNSVETNKLQRTVTGKVISRKMKDTIVVQVERKEKHPIYGKYMRRFSKMYADDKGNTCNDGDLVVIQQCRPLSKTKRWTLVEILKRDAG
jgi:small subunit ribosomal protein S17